MTCRGVPLLLCCACGTRSAVVSDDTSTPVATAPIDLQLCINELVADNATGWTDETGALVDWIELHNPTDGEVSLDGWYLTDDSEDRFAHPLGGLSIPARGFAVFAADAQPAKGPLHLSFGLDQAGEVVGLFREDGAGELIAYGQTIEDFAWARSPDCCADVVGCMHESWLGSPGASNAP